MKIQSYQNNSTIWLQLATSMTRPRPQFAPELSKCALLIVDMNEYFTSPKGRCYLPSSAHCIPNIQTLLSKWRENNGLILFAKHLQKRDSGSMFEKFYNDCIYEDYPSANIIEDLTPLASEQVIIKDSYDAFLNTSLETTLREHSITQILVTGVLTHMCVETTVRSAFCRGFEPFVPVDATAADNEDNHINALKTMAQLAAIITRSEAIINQ